VHQEQVGQRGVVGAPSTVADGVERGLRRDAARDRLGVVREVHDAHRERDALARDAVREPGAAPTLEGASERIADVSTQAEPGDELVAGLAAEVKLSTAQSWAPAVIAATTASCSSGGCAAVA